MFVLPSMVNKDVYKMEKGDLSSIRSEEGEAGGGLGVDVTDE